MKIKYTQIADYNLPKINTITNNTPLNKYGLLKLDYIKINKKTLYTKLLMSNELNDFLFSVGKEAEEKVDFLIKEFVKNDKTINENLKETNQLLWIQKMNSYKNIAEEIVLKELIYD